MLRKYIENKLNDAEKLMQNDSEEALKIFNEILEIEPENIRAINGKGSALIKMDEINEAEICFDKSISINENATALINKGVILKRRHEYEEAMHYYDKAAHTDTKMQDIVLILKKEIYEINTGASKSQLHNYTHKANDLIEKGLEFKNDKKLWDALECYNNAILEDHTCKNYANSLINDIKIFLINEFLFKKPEFKDTKLGRLKVQALKSLLIEENAQKSLTLMNFILEMDETDLEILNQKGTLLFYYNEYHEAVNYFEKCLMIDENYYYALFNKALTLRLMNKLEESLECFDKLLKLPKLEMKVKPYQLEILDKLHREKLKKLKNMGIDKI